MRGGDLPAKGLSLLQASVQARALVQQVVVVVRQELDLLVHIHLREEKEEKYQKGTIRNTSRVQYEGLKINEVPS